MRVKHTAAARAASNHAVAALDDVTAGARLLQRFAATEALLGRFPSAGRMGIRAGTRELVVSGTPYVFIYQIEASTVVILDIWHTARKPPRHSTGASSPSARPTASHFAWCARVNRDLSRASNMLQTPYSTPLWRSQATKPSGTAMVERRLWRTSAQSSNWPVPLISARVTGSAKVPT